MLKERLIADITRLKSVGFYRERLISDATFINFSANDYLSINSHPEVKEAFIKGFELYPQGSGGSMLISGYHEIHAEFERKFAEILNVDKVILFSSGYAANLSLGYFLKKLQSGSKEDPKVNIFLDKQIHASIYDGLQQSQIPYIRYLHNNFQNLHEKIVKDTKNNGDKNYNIIITESVFSITGAITDLNVLNTLRIPNAYVVLDEAHSFGVMGKDGLGLVDKNYSDINIPLRVIPLGKSMSASGAVIAGESEFIDLLLQTARPLIYSTAISPAYTYGLLKTLEFVERAHDRRAHLKELIQYFNQLKLNSTLNWHNSNTAIQFLILGCPQKALEYKEKLLEKGIFCLPLREPTVPRGQTGLRIVLNYAHTFENLEYLMQCLQKI